MSTKTKVISTSEDGRMIQVVEITTHKGHKNRKCEVYKTSRTKHLYKDLKYRPKKGRGR